MIARVLPILLLLAAAPAPETDPFLAALAGKSGPDDVAAPSFDPDVEAASWTTRPRREIVDALAARLLRGEAKGWWGASKEGTPLPAPSNRFPPDYKAGTLEVTDRLAGRIPADAAVVFFGSLAEAENSIADLAKFLPGSLPYLFAAPPGGGGDALAKAVDEILLPTIWRSNPAVRRGTRQAAILAADPDLRGAPEFALVVEVDDASLVRFHRQSTLSFENRGTKRLRVDGLDATADDGSVRSYFALEGGIAVWSTGMAFRDRILAAASGKAPTLLSPDPRAYALARATFPRVEGRALLVVPDGFLERANSPSTRSRRAAALRCDAIRLVAGSWALSKAPRPEGLRLDCPTGGTITIAAGTASATCSVHGAASRRVPLGDQPEASPAEWAGRDAISSGCVPVAAEWGGGGLSVLVPPGPPGTDLLDLIVPSSRDAGAAGWGMRILRRLTGLRSAGIPEEGAVGAYASAFGEDPESDTDRKLVWKAGAPRWEGGTSTGGLMPAEGAVRTQRPGGGVLWIGERREGFSGGTGGGGFQVFTLPLEWR